jgi:hypothetical protein
MGHAVLNLAELDVGQRQRTQGVGIVGVIDQQCCQPLIGLLHELGVGSSGHQGSVGDLRTDMFWIDFHRFAQAKRTFSEIFTGQIGHAELVVEFGVAGLSPQPVLECQYRAAVVLLLDQRLAVFQILLSLGFRG